MIEDDIRDFCRANTPPRLPVAAAPPVVKRDDPDPSLLLILALVLWPIWLPLLLWKISPWMLFGLVMLWR